VKIVTVNDYFFPQLGYQDYFLARELQKAGHEVTVIAGDRHSRFQDYEETVQPVLGERLIGPGQRLEEGIKTVRLPIWVDLRGRLIMQHLVKTIGGMKPDFVHIHCYGRFHSLWLPKKLKKRGIPFLIDDHMLYSVKRRGALAGLYYQAMKIITKYYVTPYCRSFVGVAGECSEFLRREYEIPADKIRTILLGSDTDLYYFDAKARAELRHQSGLSESDIVLSYIGKMTQDKGVDLVIDAALPLLKDRPSLFLYLLGSGPSEFVASLKGKIRSAGLEKKVLWHEAVPSAELRAHFSFADICIWPAQASTSMLDAASCERPVIGANDKVIRERISGDHGLLFESGNAADLRQKIARLVRDKALREDMGKNGRAWIEANCSWKRIAELFIAEYRRIIALR
jgi:glycosyltransferase involved in cell wall biosynthesis